MTLVNTVELFGEQLSYGLLNIIVASLAMILVGANIAILETYKFDFRDAVGGKMMSVTVLLCYIALSVLFGEPAEWRMFIAIFGLLLDSFAIYGIYQVAKGQRSLWEPKEKDESETV